MLLPVLQHTPHSTGGDLYSADLLYQMAKFALWGAVYSAARWRRERSKADDPEPFDPRKALPTILIGALAGMVVALRGLPMEPENLQIVMATVVPIANELLAAGRSERKRENDQKQ